MSFYVSISDAVFLVTSFSIFDHSDWLTYFFDVLIFVHLFNSSSVAIVALANSRWSVFFSIKLSQIGSFLLLLVLATECFFSFDIFEIPSDAFSGC